MNKEEKILFVHIGLPKTGTSALQVFFAKNAKALYKKGLRYPGVSERIGSDEVITSGNGAKIARQAFVHHSNGHVPCLTMLERALRVADRNVLLSSEYFASWDEERHAALKQYATQFGYSVKVLLYLRDQADIVATHYFQGLKRRPGYVDVKGDNFADFAKEYLNQHKYLDFSWLLSMLKRNYGEDSVRVRTTKRGDMVAGNIFSDTLEAMGLVDDNEIDHNISKINPTPNQQEMYIRAVMGMFHPSVATSDTFLKVVSRIHKETHGDASRKEENFFIDQTVVSNIRKKFAEGNGRICQEWFNGRPFDVVFDQKQYSQKQSYGVENMDVNSMIAVFGGLLVETLDRLERLEKDRGVSAGLPESELE